MPFDNTPTEITVDTPASLLIEAGIKLIAKRKHWCRGTAVKYRLSGDVAFCAWGATRASSVDGELSYEFAQANDALNAAARKRYYQDIADLNDHATHAMVLAAMHDAAAIARGKL